MADGQLLYAKRDDVYVLKLVGQIRHTISSGFDAFLEKMFTDADLKDVIIDLTETEYIDSTNLGLIAQVAQRMEARSTKKVAVISTNPDVTEVLTSLGFDQVFIIIEETAGIESGMSEIPQVELSHRNRALLVLRAHKALIDLSQDNESVFRNVVDLLERDVDQITT